MEDTAQLSAQPLEPLRITLPFVAKVEVVAHHQVDRPVLGHQILGDKVPPGHVHHPLIKAGHDHILNAVIPPHELRPVPGGAEQGHYRGIENQVLRVGVKSDGGGHSLPLGRHLAHPAQQGAVAQVHPVEKAQGDHPFCLCFLHAATPRKNS